MAIVRRAARIPVLLAAAAIAAGCGGAGAEDAGFHGAGGGAEPDDAGDAADAGDVADAGADAPDDGDTGNELDAPPEAAADSGDGAPSGVSAIRHVVIVVQENHSFDTYFGRWCTAAPGSNPTCTTGPSCCEAAPATDPSGASPVVLDDGANGAYDPNHTQSCELDEMHGGAMDRYVSGSSCSNPGNFAIAPDAVMATYHGWASSYALADRYFQSIAGQSSSNDMYFAVAQYVFTDNAYKPATNGKGCTLPAPTITYQGVTTIADLLLSAGRSFAFYAEGYAAMKAAFLCPAAPSDCPFGLPTTPCDYDPSDVPFEYYAQFADNAAYMKDFADFGVALGGSLPDVAFVKGLGYENEHPGYGTTISAGVAFVSQVVDAILASQYASDTLVLVTWDEGGGFFDHVAPPPDSTVDGQPYGTRVPLLAIGPFARKQHVSHVLMEHASIVKFLEWNFLDQTTGQLGARDAVVANLGSLLDPSTTGLAVPEN